MNLSFIILFAVLARLGSAISGQPKHNDVFNITTCYCYGKYMLNGGPDVYFESGIFYAFDYWNYHLNQIFTFNVTERISGYVNHKHRVGAQPKMPLTCMEYEGKNQLCYWRKALNARGRLSFNRYTRHLPISRLSRNWEHRSWVFSKCQEYCVSEVGLPSLDERRTNFGTYRPRGICTNDAEGLCPWKLSDHIDGYKDPDRLTSIDKSEVAKRPS